LGRKLYGYDKWETASDDTISENSKKRKSDTESSQEKKLKMETDKMEIVSVNKKNTDVTLTLTDTQIRFFKRYGYVVIPNVIDASVTSELSQQMRDFVQEVGGIDINKKSTITADNWKKVGAPFGGMLECYWRTSMEKIRQHPNPYWVTVQLIEKTWASGTEEGFVHPFGSLNPKQLWLYVDRCNFRFPTALAKIESAPQIIENEEENDNESGSGKDEIQM